MPTVVQIQVAGVSANFPESTKSGASYSRSTTQDPLRCGKTLGFPSQPFRRIAAGCDLSALGAAPDIESGTLTLTCTAISDNDPDMELRACGTQEPFLYTNAGLYDAIGNGDLLDVFNIVQGVNVLPLSGAAVTTIIQACEFGFLMLGVTNSRENELELANAFMVDRTAGLVLDLTLAGGGGRLRVGGNVSANVGGNV